ncbi:uncharacterized protein CCDC197 isoform X6 [Fukomys damarensis]|uniref:uncharacterized protein CCDC197 isoform X6 n=1 Tax=Fukomys damarensis TaxID=885580 RepID=UPI00053FEA82|nr:uncharacterized protein CCDC197 isoform X6 [Fukomys damarensis]
MKQTNQEVLCFCCSQFGLDLGSGERAPHRFRYLQTQPHWKKTPASPPAPPQRPGRVSGVAGPCLFRLPSSGNWDSAPRWHCAWLRLRLRCPGARLPLVVSETGPSQVPGLLSLSLCSLLLCIFMSISYVPGLGRATGATSLAQTWEMWSHKPHTQRSKLRLAVREAALMTPCCTMRWPEVSRKRDHISSYYCLEAPGQLSQSPAQIPSTALGLWSPKGLAGGQWAVGRATSGLAQVCAP